MIKTHIIAALIALLLFVPLPAIAQGNISRFENKLYLLNETPASRNPQFLNWQQMFSMKVISGNRQLVGKVEDITVDESGAFTGLVSEINKLNRNEQVMKHQAYEIKFHEPINAFEIPLVLADKQDVSPEALAAIAPAAGGGKILSLKAMKGAEVKSRAGRRLGVVKDVVFDEQVQAIQALVLENVPGANRYAEIAIPYDAEQITAVSDYGRIEFHIKNAAAATVTDFAKGRR